MKTSLLSPTLHDDTYPKWSCLEKRKDMIDHGEVGSGKLNIKVITIIKYFKALCLKSNEMRPITIS